jgi:hypothetical protein
MFTLYAFFCNRIGFIFEKGFFFFQPFSSWFFSLYYKGELAAGRMEAVCSSEGVIPLSFSFPSLNFQRAITNIADGFYNVTVVVTVRNT